MDKLNRNFVLILTKKISNSINFSFFISFILSQELTFAFVYFI